MQISIYLNLNNILFSGQHGFRNGHSCETALHELISYLNENRNSRAISLLLFIDFRKAFDLVDSKKLLRKLFHYGFDNSALDVIANYFNDRHQSVKYEFFFFIISQCSRQETNTLSPEGLPLSNIAVYC
jgi:hypothetical protein